MRLRIVMMACRFCEDHFFVEESVKGVCCAFCGRDEDLYATYTYEAEPTYEEV